MELKVIKKKKEQKTKTDEITGAFSIDTTISQVYFSTFIWTLTEPAGVCRSQFGSHRHAARELHLCKHDPQQPKACMPIETYHMPEF